ncbi:MAG: nuclear transport factor 2 family protein [Cyanobacteria bacterium NC_groundwater_1444_Ag_S-0.65um_54_12]|nr:nuclear transport factor 2 family protein [Cyanobacteria bacterium NC_groundwater_1444_Ag_S-0.65um_54_12]
MTNEAIVSYQSACDCDRALKQYQDHIAESNDAVVARKLFDAIQARDWVAAEVLFLPDAVMTWWTTSERFEGAKAIIHVNAVYPEGWSITVEHINPLADGRVHSVIQVDQSPRSFYANSIFRFCDGRIAQLDEWWATVEEPPVWRSDGQLPGYRRLGR